MAIPDEDTDERAAIAWFDDGLASGESINQTWIGRLGTSEIRVLDIACGQGRHRLLCRVKPIDDGVWRWDDLDYEDLEEHLDEIKAMAARHNIVLRGFAGPMPALPARLAPEADAADPGGNHAEDAGIRRYPGDTPDEYAAVCVASAAEYGFTLVIRPETLVIPDELHPKLSRRGSWAEIDDFAREWGEMGCRWINLRFALDDSGGALVRYEGQPKEDGNSSRTKGSPGSTADSTCIGSCPLRSGRPVGAARVWTLKDDP